MSGSDKRLYPRIEANVYIDMTGDEILLFHAIENISLGGISVSSSNVENKGAMVELVLNFPGRDDALECMGEVVWTRDGNPPSMGIMFTSLTDQDKEFLKEFLSKSDQFYS